MYFIIIIGDKEIQSQNYPLRARGGKDLGKKSIHELLEFLENKVKNSVKSFS